MKNLIHEDRNAIDGKGFKRNDPNFNSKLLAKSIATGIVTLGASTNKHPQQIMPELWGLTILKGVRGFSYQSIGSGYFKIFIHGSKDEIKPKSGKYKINLPTLEHLHLRKVMEGFDDWRMVFYREKNIGQVILTDSGTTLDLDLIVPKKLRGKGLGKEIFKRSIELWDPIQIRATWKVDKLKYKDSKGASDNLTIFIKNLKTMDEKSAALNTPTGKIANDLGFNKILSINQYGNLVQVVFAK